MISFLQQLFSDCLIIIFKIFACKREHAVRRVRDKTETENLEQTLCSAQSLTRGLTISQPWGHNLNGNQESGSDRTAPPRRPFADMIYDDLTLEYEVWKKGDCFINDFVLGQNSNMFNRIYYCSQSILELVWLYHFPSFQCCPCKWPHVPPVVLGDLDPIVSFAHTVGCLAFWGPGRSSHWQDWQSWELRTLSPTAHWAHWSPTLCFRYCLWRTRKKVKTCYLVRSRTWRSWVVGVDLLASSTPTWDGSPEKEHRVLSEQPWQRRGHILRKGSTHQEDAGVDRILLESWCVSIPQQSWRSQSTCGWVRDTYMGAKVWTTGCSSGNSSKWKDRGGVGLLAISQTREEVCGCPPVHRAD